MEKQRLKPFRQEVKKMKNVILSLGNKKALIYWHKGANSGLWTALDRETAIEMGEDLAKQESMYNVEVIDMLTNERIVIKG